MDQNLTELLQRKQQQSGSGAPIDWGDRRYKYFEAVRGLYQQIETALAEPIRQQTVAMQRRRKELTEPYIGSYSADDLIVVIGDEQVRFSPRGRNIAGADGRVDVIGERGVATIVCSPKAFIAVVPIRAVRGFMRALGRLLFQG